MTMSVDAFCRPRGYVHAADFFVSAFPTNQTWTRLNSDSAIFVKTTFDVRNDRRPRVQGGVIGVIVDHSHGH
jgi:hypothetical protein